MAVMVPGEPDSGFPIELFTSSAPCFVTLLVYVTVMRLS